MSKTPYDTSKWTADQVRRVALTADLLQCLTPPHDKYATKDLLARTEKMAASAWTSYLLNMYASIADEEATVGGGRIWQLGSFDEANRGHYYPKIGEMDGKLYMGESSPGDSCWYCVYNANYDPTNPDEPQELGDEVADVICKRLSPV